MRSLATGAAVVVAAATYGVGIDAGADTTSSTPDSNSANVTTATTTYTVRAGDTLYSIARRFGTTVDVVAQRNALADAARIRAGQILVIPVPGAPSPSGSAATLDTQRVNAVNISYTVAPGDTLNGIARRFGTSAQSLAAANGMANANLIFVGQVVMVPLSTRDGLPAAGASPTVAPNGVLDAVLVDPNATPPPTNPPPTSPPPTVPPVSPTVAPPPAPPTVASLPIALFGSVATDPTRLALVPSFDRWADNYRIPRGMIKGLAFVESTWRADALSSAGAVGIGQLMPDTSRWIATTLIGDPSLDPRKPDDNIRMTARYLRYLLDNTSSEANAIGAYYQGIGSVQRNGIGPVTQQYIDRVQAARAAFG